MKNQHKEGDCLKRGARQERGVSVFEGGGWLIPNKHYEVMSVICRIIVFKKLFLFLLKYVVRISKHGIFESEDLKICRVL